MNEAKQLLEKAGLSETHWGKSIIRAEKNDGFNVWDKEFAADWTTCACGKQDPRIPREGRGSPVDPTLFELGVSFSGQVDFDQILAAAETLIRIEKRATEVLEEVRANEG